MTDRSSCGVAKTVLCGAYRRDTLIRGGHVIEIRQLSKRYGDTLAVDDLSFDVIPGKVTGFLGPNGAGKSTTMRAIVGLDRPTHGGVRVNGHRYVDNRAPLQEIGALLEAKAVHPGRSGYNHLLFLARSNGIPRRRVDEVLEQVGLASVARRRAGKFSLGMGQRLGIAAALLGDPPTMIFDEPVNGLDPEGIIWVRNLLRSYAAQGRAVLVSSHLMAEMALTADQLVVIGRGRLIADTGVEDFVRRASSGQVLVRSAEQDRLRAGLVNAGARVVEEPDGTLLVEGMESPAVGKVAAGLQVALHELTPRRASLEEAFMELTADSVDYHAHADVDPGDRPAAREWALAGAAAARTAGGSPAGSGTED
jgi:ABC-2 type transport system ATP-binding protein